MKLRFSCPLCGKQLAANPSIAGKEVSCPKCRASVRVPTESTAAAAKVDECAAADHGSSLVRPAGGGHEDLIDMTAMVDIVFFLLIFFMVTSIQALESVIGLPTPQTSNAAPSAQVVADVANDPSFITVTIEADDTIWVEEEQAFGGQDLRVKLRNLREQDFQPTGMIVLGHPDASHASLVTVLDAGTDAGLTDLRFSVTESLDGG
jgi:biopolymer transport protein ExbD